MSEVLKPGWKTTEFWMVVVANITAIIGVIESVIPADVATIVVTVLDAIYTILRTLAKYPAVADITTLVKK